MLLNLINIFSVRKEWKGLLNYIKNTPSHFTGKALKHINEKIKKSMVLNTFYNSNIIKNKWQPYFTRVCVNCGQAEMSNIPLEFYKLNSTEQLLLIKILNCF